MRRNGSPLGIQRPKFEVREVKSDRTRIWAKEWMEFRGDDGRIAGVRVCRRIRCSGIRFGRPCDRPRVGTRRLALEVVADVGFLGSIIER